MQNMLLVDNMQFVFHMWWIIDVTFIFWDNKEIHLNIEMLMYSRQSLYEWTYVLN